MQIVKHYNRDSYLLESGKNAVYITELGGKVMPYFSITESREAVTPYAVAPWWNEENATDDEMLAGLRGSFLCLPMGGDPDGVYTKGEPVPAHGWPACGKWSLVSEEAGQDAAGMVLEFHEPKGTGKVRKLLTLSAAAPVLYERDVITGYSGKYPISFHPCVRLAGEKGSCRISMSRPLYGTTTPNYSESTEQGGYCLLRRQEIQDYTDVESVYGERIDLSRQPLQAGIEDILGFISDGSLPFAYTAVTVPSENYVYFQLKNPRKLRGTMFWISNGGRHYAPWNGRVRNLIGLEETTSYFHYGTKASVDKNILSDHGADTSIELSPEREFSVALITGMAQIPEGFGAVKDITAGEDDRSIVIHGSDGKRVSVSVDLDFLERS